MTIKIVYIEDKVVYDPSTHSIYSIDDDSTQASLAIPASLCFLALIQNQGDVVSHNELLSFAWSSRGMSVSQNTLYQNVSLLRKALESFGVTGEIIRTVPKRGFVIPTGFPIKIIDKTEADITADDSEQVINLTSPSDVYVPLPEKWKTTKLSAFFFLLVCSVAFSLTYLISDYLNEDIIPVYIPPKFVKMESIGDCHVFRNYSLRENVFFTHFLSGINAACGKEKWWYLTNYPPGPQISLLKCTVDITAQTADKTSLCISDFYTGNGR